MVLCGHRGKEDQESAVVRGTSKQHWPNSKHNTTPAQAVDLAPLPINWEDIKRFDDMCNKIARIAQALDIPIRQGRDFSFKDYPHTELV